MIMDIVILILIVTLVILVVLVTTQGALSIKQKSEGGTIRLETLIELNLLTPSCSSLASY